jgi:threonine synthase
VQPDRISGRAGEKVRIPDLLPYDPGSLPAFPAGGTSLSAPGRLRDCYGFSRLFFKNDHLNPSGSLKDRASLLVALQALALGERTVTVASTGNAGSAMASAGAAAGLDVVLLVPESAPKAKLLQSLLYGAKVVPIKGDYDAAFELSIEYTQMAGGINRNTAYNPLTLEGKKTVALEIYNQLGGRVPDAVYIPAGDGVIFSGAYKGFLLLVQAEGSNAIAGSFSARGRAGLRACHRAERILPSVRTFADSIAVANPAAGEMAIRGLIETGGRAIEVSDEEIRSAQKELCAKAGAFVEPSSAAAWAGFLVDRGNLDPENTVVILLTGNGFKDIREAETLISMPASCEPEIDAVLEYLSANPNATL